MACWKRRAGARDGRPMRAHSPSTRCGGRVRHVPPRYHPPEADGQTQSPSPSKLHWACSSTSLATSPFVFSYPPPAPHIGRAAGLTPPPRIF
eukprot:scaffold14621_cov55-Isochrysis_galbana.AAC.1